MGIKSLLQRPAQKDRLVRKKYEKDVAGRSRSLATVRGRWTCISGPRSGLLLRAKILKRVFHGVRLRQPQKRPFAAHRLRQVGGSRRARLALANGTGDHVQRARTLLGYRQTPSLYATARAIGVTHQTVERCLRRALGLTGMAETMVIAIASKSRVKPLSGRAQGAAIFLPGLPARPCAAGALPRCRQVIRSVS